MKKTILILVVLALAGGGGWWYWTAHKKTNTVQFKTVNASRGNLRAMVTATGTVNAVTNVLVGTQVSGTIKEIFVDFNSPVKKGQLLAQIDPALSEARVAQAKANLQAAVANVEKSETALADATRTLERNRTLFTKNYIARSEFDAAETAQRSALAQLNMNKAQVEQQTANLNQEETNLRYTRILSPVNGIVISRNVDIGQTVAASFQTPTLFSIAEDLTRMQIDTNVDEADIGRVRVGQDVEFTVDAYPDSTFRGQVSEVRNAPTTIQNVVTYNVIVRVSNPELKLKPGMTANVSIVTAGAQNVLTIPNAALRFKWQPAGGAAPGAVAGAAGAKQGGGPGAVGADITGSAQEAQKGQAGGAAGGGKKALAGQRGGDATGQTEGMAGAGRPAGERKGRPEGGAAGGGKKGFAGRPGGEGAAQIAAGAPESRGGRTAAALAEAGGPGAARSRQSSAPASVQASVWVLDGQAPRRVSVTLGITDGSSTAVLSGGLQEGDPVIVGSSAAGQTARNAQGGPPGGRFL
jgi:HlyD family secretion protein